MDLRRRKFLVEDEEDLQKTSFSKAKGSNPQRNSVSAIFLVALLVYALALFLVALGFDSSLPEVSHDPSSFMETNARIHVKELAEKIGKRMVGSKEEKMTEDYLLRILHDYKNNSLMPQFDIEVQKGSGAHRFDFMGTVVRLSCGEKCNKNAVLLNAHYDSLMGSQGASDDAVGVGVLLELVRTLSLNPPQMKNAAIFLFNGAEETLQDASHLFITQHPFRKSIKTVINLESCGQSGKEVAFQIGSAEMVKAYQGVPHPHGTVFANDLFKTGLILSDTDYRQFVDYGNISGIDMAFYQNSYVYHTMLDMEETITPGSIQHMGDNALHLVKHFMSQEFYSDQFKDEMIYFDFLGLVFICYNWFTANILSFMSICFTIIYSTVTFWNLSKQVGLNQSSGCASKAITTLLFYTFINIPFTLVSAILLSNLIAMFMKSIGFGMVWFRREYFCVILFAPAAFLGLYLAQHIFFLLNLKWKTPQKRMNKKCDEKSGRKDIFSPLGNPFSFKSGFVHFSSDPVLIENLTMNGLVNFLTILLIIGSFSQVASTYIIFIMLASIQLPLLSTWILSKNMMTFFGKHSHIQNGNRFKSEAKENSFFERIRLSTYFAALGIPCIYTSSIGISVINLFVPLTGRIGPDAPVDLIIATLVGLFVILGYLCLIPLFSRMAFESTSTVKFNPFHLKENFSFPVFLSAIQFLSILWFCFFSGIGYDVYHPQRVFLQHWRNITQVNQHEAAIHEAIYIAQPDSGPFKNEVLVPVLHGLNQFMHSTLGKEASASAFDSSTSQLEEQYFGVLPWKHQKTSPSYREFDSLFPFTQFLHIYRIALSSGRSDILGAKNKERLYHSSFKMQIPTMKLIRDGFGTTTIDGTTRRYRSVEVECFHPDFKYIIYSFEGHILEWHLGGCDDEEDSQEHLLDDSNVMGNEEVDQDIAEIWEWHHEMEFSKDNSTQSWHERKFVTSGGQPSLGGKLHPFQSPMRYVIRHSAGFGGDSWTIKLKYVLPEESPSKDRFVISLTGISGEDTLPSIRRKSRWEPSQRNPLFQAIAGEFPDHVQPFMMEVVHGDFYL